jgi:hypothetical protein
MRSIESRIAKLEAFGGKAQPQLFVWIQADGPGDLVAWQSCKVTVRRAIGESEECLFERAREQCAEPVNVFIEVRKVVNA